jgi:hypothetical protein
MIDVADVHVLSIPCMERIREYLKISRGRVGMGEREREREVTPADRHKA